MKLSGTPSVPPGGHLAAPKSAPSAEPTFVVLGDSLSAGTQDAVTVGARQEMGYAAQMARAAGVPFRTPRITGPGLPFPIFRPEGFAEEPFRAQRNVLVNALAPLAAWTYYLGVPPFLYPAVWDMLGFGVRDPESIPAKGQIQNNFAISGMEARHLTTVATARDFLKEIHEKTTGFTEVGDKIPLIRATLQQGGRERLGSQVDQAIATRPDLVMLWAGGNDALEGAFAGYVDDRTLTPVEDRRWTFRDTGPLGGTRTRETERVMPGVRSSFVGPQGAITRLLAETEAEILVGTVPDVAVVPNLRPLGQAVGPLPFRVVLADGTDVTADLERLVLPNTVRGPGLNGRLVFPAGSAVSLTTLLETFLQNGPVETASQFHGALHQVSRMGWFSEDQVLDPEEAQQIEQRVEEYNQVLREAAAANPRVHLVDLAGELQRSAEHGRPLRGEGPPVTVTTTFTGVRDGRGFEGLFSFDGVHPSDTGHAVIANILLDYVKAHLAHDPRFAKFLATPAIDEKKVFAADPHRGPSELILDAGRIEQLRSAV